MSRFGAEIPGKLSDYSTSIQFKLATKATLEKMIPEERAEIELIIDRNVAHGKVPGTVKNLGKGGVREVLAKTGMFLNQALQDQG